MHDKRTKRRWVISLLDTLVVDGLRLVLWSVPKLASEGHRITFDGTHVKLVLNSTSPRDTHLTLLIAHPYLRQTVGPTVAIRTMASNIIETKAYRRRLRAEERSREQSQELLTSQASHPLSQ